MSRRGFTLIELVIVVAILGILAAIAAPKMGCAVMWTKGYTQQAGIAVIKEAARLKTGALVANGTFTGAYPQLTVDDFKENRYPINPINNLSAINYVTEPVSGGTASGEYGWWFVISGDAAGMVGAYDNQDTPYSFPGFGC